MYVHTLTAAPGDVALSIRFYVRNNRAWFWVSLSDRYKKQSPRLEHIIRLGAAHNDLHEDLDFHEDKKRFWLDIFDFANCRGEGGSNTVNRRNFLRTHTHIKKLHPAASRSGSNTHTVSANEVAAFSTLLWSYSSCSFTGWKNTVRDKVPHHILTLNSRAGNDRLCHARHHACHSGGDSCRSQTCCLWCHEITMHYLMNSKYVCINKTWSYSFEWNHETNLIWAFH